MFCRVINLQRVELYQWYYQILLQVEDTFDEFDTEEFEGIDSDPVTNAPPTGAKKDELKFAKVIYVWYR